jgi:hypothetical protein
MPATAKPAMDGPAIYRIRVGGSLDADWASRLGGMSITSSRGADGGAESTLVGRVADQSALSGLLNGLYELHLPVISVECLESG